MTQQSSRLDIIIDSRQAQRNGEQLRITLNNLVVVGDQASQSMSGAGSAARAAGVAFAALGAGRVVSEIIRLTDAFKSMQGSLALVSSSNSVASDSFQKLLTMANNTGSSLESTVSLYTRLANATRGAGYTTAQLLGVTDAINKAFVISGATMQEASNAAIQLSQGLASGTLRGEELNSVMEQGPRITRALAEYLGVTNGQIRQMAADGKITAEVVTNALLKSLSSLNTELERMPRRFEQASTALKNNFLASIGQIDIDPLIGTIDALAISLTDPKIVDGIQSIAQALGGVAAFGGGILKPVIGNADALIAVTGAYAAKVGVGLVSSLGLAVKARIADAAAASSQVVTSRRAALAAANEALAVQSASVANAEAAVARSIYARTQAASAAASQAASVLSIEAVTAQLVADRALETQRLQAQINDAGRSATLTRLAEIRLAEAATTRQQVAAEAALVVARAEEVAADTAATAALARLTALREASIPVVAAATGAQNALNTATLAGARGLALLGGPIGAITLAATVAAGAYLFFKDSADAGTQSLIDQNLTLDETAKKFDSLTAAQQRNQASKWAEAQQAALDQASAAASKYGNIAENAITSVGAARVSDLTTLSSMIAQVKSGQKTLDDVTIWMQSTQGLTGGFKSSLEGIAAGYDTNIQSAGGYAERLRSVSSQTQGLSANNGKLAISQGEVSKSNSVGSDAWEKYIGQLTKARDLVGANAAAEAAYNAVKMGANAAQVEQAKAIAAQTDLLNKYQEAVKENNKAEQERLKVLLVASYTAVQAAEDLVAAKKKADAEAAKSAEDSSKRQITAIEKVAAASYASLLTKPAAQQSLGGYGLLTNGGTAPAAPVTPRKTPQQMAEERMAQVLAGTTPNKPTKDPKGPSEKGALNSAISAFDALYKKANPAAQAVRDLTEAQEKLQLALSKGKITQEQYGVALGQASRDYAMAIAKTGELSQAEKDRIEVLKLTGQAMAANAAQSNLDDAAQRIEYERQGNFEALKRLGTLKQIRDINLKAEIKPGTIEGVSQAPTSPGLDATVGGAGSELDKLAEAAAKLDEWRANELEKQKGYLDLKAISEETYAERIRNIDEQALATRTRIEQTKNQAILSGASTFFGNMASLSQSENKKLAAIGKAAAITQATIDGYSAVQRALAAFPPPFNFIAAAAVGVAAAANVANIAGVGFSEGGYTGPGRKYQPAGVVHKGEVVWSQADISRSGGVAAVEAMRRGDVMPAGMSLKAGSSVARSESNSKASSPSMSVEIHNYSSARVSTQTDEAGRLRVIIQEVEAHLVQGVAQGNGDFNNVLEHSYGLSRQGY